MHEWIEVHTSTFGLWNVYWEAVCKREQKQFVTLKFFVWCDLSHWVSLAISSLSGKGEGMTTDSHIYGLFPDASDGKESACHVGDLDSIPGRTRLSDFHKEFELGIIPSLNLHFIL